MKIKLITTSNHELALREIAYLISGKAKTELYNLNCTKRTYDNVTLKNIINALTKAPADLYLFTLRELDRLRSFQIADELRKIKLKTIAGGTYAFSNIKESLKHFDAVIVGDSKNALETILNGQEGVIYGGIAEPTIESYDVSLFYLENSQVKKSETGLRPFKHPQYKETKEISFTTMRGCSQSCPYCEVSQLRRIFPEYRLRKKSLEDVLKYVGERVKGIKPDYIYIWDEDFLLHSNSEIDKFVKLYNDINIPFFIFATPKTVIYGKNKLERLAEVGLDQVNMGIQSGSERIQKQLFGRKESLEEGKEATRILVELYKKYKSTMKPPMIDFITLNPYENEDDVIASIRYVLELPKPFNLIVHVMNFFEGTPLKSDALKKNLISWDYSFDHDLHDFVNHAKDALNGRRKSSFRDIYLSSVLFRMRDIHYGEECGMINCKEVGNLLSSKTVQQYSKSRSDILDLIEEMKKKYNPMLDNSF